MLPEAPLIAAAFLAGVLNTVAGGGTLLTFPSLVGYGLTARLANTTSTVALVPASLGGAWGFRRELAGTGPWLALLLPPSVAGGAVGGLLLIALPERYFDRLVPWLLLTAALLFWAQPYLAHRFVAQAGAAGMPSWGVRLAVVFFQLLVAVYGGYFGAGIGILMLTALAFMGLGDIHRMNAVKAILGTAINGTSVVVFVATGEVVWRLAALMAVGAVAGGLAGAAVGRRLPKLAVRWFVISVGLALAAYYFLKQAG